MPAAIDREKLVDHFKIITVDFAKICFSKATKSRICKAGAIVPTQIRLAAACKIRLL